MALQAGEPRVRIPHAPSQEAGRLQDLSARRFQSTAAPHSAMIPHQARRSPDAGQVPPPPPPPASSSDRRGRSVSPRASGLAARSCRVRQRLGEPERVRTCRNPHGVFSSPSQSPLRRQESQGRRATGLGWDGVPRNPRLTPGRPGGQPAAPGLIQLYDLLVEVTRKPARRRARAPHRCRSRPSGGVRFASRLRPAVSMARARPPR
jgi:hypothetical protein